MATFKTQIKNTFEAGLKPYGFVKSKTNHPYFVRVVNGEILHIITYKTEWSDKPKIKKRFSILVGVATIYRKEIDIEKPVTSLTNWLRSIRNFAMNYKKFEESKEEMPLYFEYNPDDMESMEKSIEYALGMTKEILVPLFENVNTLKECVDYYFDYTASMLNVYADDRYVLKWMGNSYNEGLLSTILYENEIEKYIKRLKDNEKDAHEKIDKMYQKSDSVNDDCIELHNGIRKHYQGQIEAFKTLVTDKEWNQKVKEELKRRKQHNLEILERCKLI